MKVFFIGTPRGDLDRARRIYDGIAALGFAHTTDFMLQINPESFYTNDESVWEKRYLSRLKEIASADICVFEVSMHSLAVGQLVQEAIRREKPVILLAEEGKKPYFFRGAEGVESRVMLAEYNEQSVKEVLRDCFEWAKELLTVRFTMLMPSGMVRYLDKVNDEEGVSRSEFIRRLIAEKMKTKP